MTARTWTGRAWSDVLGEDIRYRVRLPADHGRAPCAVAYLLHGRGHDLDSWAEAWADVEPELDELAGRGDVPPVVLVVPDAPWGGRAGWYVDSAHTGEPVGRAVETALTRDLVRHVDATFSTVPERSHRVLGGYSMGGAGALGLLLRRPDLFGGGVVLAPAVYDPLPPADSSTRSGGAFGRGQERFVDDAYAPHSTTGLLDGYASRGPAAPPVRLFVGVGDDEWHHPAPEDARHDLDRVSVDLHERARRVPGITSRLRLLSGGHDRTVWGPGLVAGLPFAFGGTEEVTR